MRYRALFAFIVFLCFKAIVYAQVKGPQPLSADDKTVTFEESKNVVGAFLYNLNDIIDCGEDVTCYQRIEKWLDRRMPKRTQYVTNFIKIGNEDRTIMADRLYRNVFTQFKPNPSGQTFVDFDYTQTTQDVYWDADAEKYFVLIEVHVQITGTHIGGAPYQSQSELTFSVEFGAAEFDGTINTLFPKIYGIHEGQLDRSKFIKAPAAGVVFTTKPQSTPSPTQAQVSKPTVAQTRVINITESPCAEPSSAPRLIDGSWKSLIIQDKDYLKAVKDGIEGRGILRFTVLSDGTIADSIVVDKMDKCKPDCDYVEMVAFRLAKNSENWGVNGWESAKRNCSSFDTLIERPFDISAGFIERNKNTQTVSGALSVPSSKPQNTASSKGREQSQKRIDTSEKPIRVADQPKNIAPLPVPSDKRRLIRFNNREGRDIQYEWDKFVSSEYDFIEAVLKNGLRGTIDFSVFVEADGSVKPIYFNKPYHGGVSVIERLIDKSKDYQKGWLPAQKSRSYYTSREKFYLTFSPQKLNRNAALESGLLQGKLKKRWEKKAEWEGWKEKKKGGVHFSVGGGYVLELNSNNDRYRYNKDNPISHGAIHASFGGLFSNHAGMELKGSWMLLSNRKEYVNERSQMKENKDLQVFSVGLGVVVNASPNRYPLRFYFTSAPFVRWRLFNKSFSDFQFGTELGLFCFDVKIARDVAVYFEIGRGSIPLYSFETGEIVFSNLFAQVQWTPAVGLRFGRW